MLFTFRWRPFDLACPASEMDCWRLLCGISPPDFANYENETICFGGWLTAAAVVPPGRRNWLSFHSGRKCRHTAGKVTPRRQATNHLFSTSDPNHRAEWQRRLTLGPGDRLNLMLFERPDGKRNPIIAPTASSLSLKAEGRGPGLINPMNCAAAIDKELTKFYDSPRTIITPITFPAKSITCSVRVAQRSVHAKSPDDHD